MVAGSLRQNSEPGSPMVNQAGQDHLVRTSHTLRISCCRKTLRSSRSSSAFTLIELMAVVLVILVLVAISMGVMGYVQSRIAISRARSEIAAIQTALESYKSDWGYYPTTGRARISNIGFCESSNNLILYRALSGVDGGKQYMRFAPGQLKMSVGGANRSFGSSGASSARGGLTNICDPWSTPYNYYCSPRTPTNVVNTLPGTWPAYASPAWNYLTNFWSGGYMEGGQINVSSYDLWSYGPDRSTYVPGAIPYGGGFNYAWGVPGGGVAASDRWTNSTKSIDDIGNFK